MLGFPTEEIPWSGALMIGAALSPTDPGEILSVLKSESTSVRFNSLLEGEGMMNTGMSLLCYQIFNSLVKLLALNKPVSGIKVAF